MKGLTEPLTECGSVCFWSGRDVIPWLRASLSLSQTFQDPEMRIPRADCMTGENSLWGKINVLQ